MSNEYPAISDPVYVYEYNVYIYIFVFTYHILSPLVVVKCVFECFSFHLLNLALFTILKYLNGIFIIYAPCLYDSEISFFFYRFYHRILFLFIFLISTNITIFTYILLLIEILLFYNIHVDIIIVQDDVFPQCSRLIQYYL